MNQTTLKPTNNPNSPDIYQPMLKESVDRFIAEYHSGATNFSSFSSIFSRLVQTLPDPPLEIVWFYSAVTFHRAKFVAKDSSKPVLLAKDLFQLLVSCSSSCNVVIKIAVLAPVIYELYHSVFDERVLKGEAENLIEGVVSYISICCGKEQNPEGGMVVGLNSCFEDLVRVWMVDKFCENCKIGYDLRVFFPVVSDDVRKGISVVGCEVGYLAGVVMSEAFFLRLCLKLESESSRTELEKDMQNWAVQMISGFRSCNFLEWLLIIENEGVRVFDCNISKVQAEAVIYKSRVEYVIPVIKPDGRNLDDNLIFNSFKQGREEDKFDGDLEMVDSMHTVSSYAGMVNIAASDGTRKRKEGIKDEGELQVKFVKYQVHDNSVREKFLPLGNDDGLSSGSEVDNPISDEDMEEMEQ